MDTGGRGRLSPQLLSELRSPPGGRPELLQELRCRSSAAESTGAGRGTTATDGNTGSRTELGCIPHSARVARSRAPPKWSALSIPNTANPAARRGISRNPGRRLCRLRRRLDCPVTPDLRRAEIARFPSPGRVLPLGPSTERGIMARALDVLADGRLEW